MERSIPLRAALRPMLTATALALLLAAPPSHAQLAADETTIAAWVYGYPLVLMDVTRQVMTATPSPTDRKAPLNQFAHMQRFPDASFTDVVSPNADTLYSSAWIDVSKEPLVMHVPAMGDRYYLLPVLDAWTNVVAAPGTRTGVKGPADFAIVGPGWKGTLPAGVREIRSPTPMNWIIGRIYTTGGKDYDAVHALQRQLTLTPLSSFGKPYTPPAQSTVPADLDTKTAPATQVAKMDGLTFFGRLCKLLKTQPPSPPDAVMSRRLAELGITSADCNLQKLELARRTALDRSAVAGLQRVTDEAKHVGKQVNGWDVLLGTGAYGTDYLRRAAVALLGLGANLSEDAVYPAATTDATGAPLTGNNRYVIHFPKGQLPPVNAFWSLTLYNEKQFFVANPLNRYNLSSRDPLKANADGSVDLYVQNQSPGPELQSNWLPAPAGPFNLMLRLYWPKPQVLDLGWKPPLVSNASQR